MTPPAEDSPFSSWLNEYVRTFAVPDFGPPATRQAFLLKVDLQRYESHVRKYVVPKGHDSRFG